MIMAFNIVLIIIMVISFIGSVGEKQNKALRNNMTALCIASMVSFIISVLWL